MFINITLEHEKLLREKEKKYSYHSEQSNKFHEDSSLDGNDTFEDIAELTKIINLPLLIEKHRKIVSEQYLDNYNGLIYNERKFGIDNIRETRFREKENIGIEIDLFETDYFTHRVFRSIYQELKEINHPIKLADRDNYLQYRPFLTSFGINTLLICKGESGKEIVLSKRSSRVHGNTSRYHITMNEGLSLVDKDIFGTISIENLCKRGLKEELGIDENLFKYISKSAFYDLFLEKNKFEIGITSVVVMDISFSKFIEPVISRDKSLEFDAFLTLPMKKVEIKEFIMHNEFVPHGLYTLDRVLLRENIFNTSLLF